MLLTVKDVAMRLNVSQSCIYQLVESGRIPHHRIGLGRGAIRFTDEDVDSFLAASRNNDSGEWINPRPSRQKVRHLKL